MVAFPRLTSLIPAIGAAVAGVCVATAVALTPTGTLEDWVWQGGLAALVPAAAPPLGMTARTMLTVGAAVMAAAVMWSILYLLFGEGGVFAPKAAARDAAPTLRRADAHPDAPARWPMTAADLGTPLMEVPPPPPTSRPVPPPPVERALPVDLDQRLAAFHPEAILPVPLPPIQTVKPLREPLAPGERMETFVLTPVEPPTEPAPSAPVPRESIEALLARLEAHAGGRPRGAASR